MTEQKKTGILRNLSKKAGALFGALAVTSSFVSATPAAADTCKDAAALTTGHSALSLKDFACQILYYCPTHTALEIATAAKQTPRSNGRGIVTDDGSIIAEMVRGEGEDAVYSTMNVYKAIEITRDAIEINEKSLDYYRNKILCPSLIARNLGAQAVRDLLDKREVYGINPRPPVSAITAPAPAHPGTLGNVGRGQTFDRN